LVCSLDPLRWRGAKIDTRGAHLHGLAPMTRLNVAHQMYDPFYVIVAVSAVRWVEFWMKSAVGEVGAPRAWAADVSGVSAI
jgi:hypothetical protein